MPLLGICPTDDFEPNSGEVLRVGIVEITVNDLKDLATRTCTSARCCSRCDCPLSALNLGAAACTKVLVCLGHTGSPQLAKDKLKRLHVKVPQTFLRILDGWRRKQPDLPSRSEAIRRLVASGAAVRARSSAKNWR
jgi:hypothetical protein